MTCENVLDLMQKFVDQEHTNSEYAEMSEHLYRCPSCTAIFERLKRLSDQLEQLPKVVPAYSIVDTILPKLERMNLLYQPTWKERFMERFPYKTIGSLAAGIVLLVVIMNSNLPGGMKSADMDSNLLNMETMNSTAGNSGAAMQDNRSDTKAKEEPAAESSATAEPKAVLDTGEVLESETVEPETPAPAESPVSDNPEVNNSDEPSEEAKRFKSPSPPEDKNASTTKAAITSTPAPQTPAPELLSEGDEAKASASQEEQDTRAEFTPSEPPDAVFTTDAEQFPSGDGAYIAYIQQNGTSQEVVIVNQKFEPVFTSFPKEVEQILNFLWSEDSKTISFDTVAGPITRHYSVNLVKMQESEHVR